MQQHAASRKQWMGSTQPLGAKSPGQQHEAARKQCAGSASYATGTMSGCSSAQFYATRSLMLRG